MNKNADSKFNRHVMGVAAEHQRKLQRQVGTNWWYRSSKTSVILTVISEIGFYFTLLMNAVISLSYIMLLERNATVSNWAAERAQIKTALGSFLFGTLLIIAAYILKKISRRRVKLQGSDNTPLMLISMIGFIVGCVLLAITAYDVLIVSNADNMYAEAVEGATSTKIYVELICMHLVPILFMLVPAVLFYVMHRCDFNEKKQIYDRMTEMLYKDFVAENPDYSIEQWEACLNSFQGYEDYSKSQE